MRQHPLGSASGRAQAALDEPVIILTCARSGSTLLRLILDAHPDLACPPETNIVKACWQLATAYSTIHELAEDGRVSGRASEPVDAAVAAVFKQYLADRGKSRWCDKSLGTAPVAGWFAGLYPKAKFVCLYRHCMDVMFSGLEASPWGLMGYGFEEFAGLKSGNSLSALAAYWIEHTGRILEFERANEGRCSRVYYERLVENPEAVADEIFSFLGVPPAPGITERCLGIQPGDPGPGDHKIRATRKITADSVGRGIRIPVGMIPVPQLQVMNHLLGELGYAPVDEAWRKSACPPQLLPGADVGGQRPRAESAAPGSFADGFARSVLANIGEVFRARVHAGFPRMAPRRPEDRQSRSHAFVLVAYHFDEDRMALSWRVDLRKQEITQLTVRGDSSYQADWLVTGDIETWLAVLAGRANMAACIRHGMLRYIELGDSEQHDERAQNPDSAVTNKMEGRLAVVRALLGLSGYPEEISTL